MKIAINSIKLKQATLQHFDSPAHVLLGSNHIFLIEVFGKLLLLLPGSVNFLEAVCFLDGTATEPAFQLVDIRDGHIQRVALN